MTFDDLKSHVTNILHDEWPIFAIAHPHLARASEEPVWAVTIAESLHDDPQFQAAMSDAHTLGTVLEQGPAIVRDFVRKWLSRLA
mgnify:CR=1 FL=1